MKTILIMILLFMAANDVVCCEKTGNPVLSVTVNKDANSSTGVYIPKNLEDCFNELDKMLHSDAKKYLAEKNEETFRKNIELQKFFSHMQLGLFLRNKWGLWKKNRLVEYFKKLEIFHPDDMSEIILNSYQRYLQKKPIKLDEQVASYKEYWKKATVPEPFVDPQTGKEVKVRSSIYLENRYINIGYSKDSNNIWIYEYDKGWYKPNKELLKKLGYPVN
ncbi:hypothetical protein DENIS_3854 [Desulfonema ishimotonii]|uniref:DUF6794 domain-containing protein n=1 Tax=Desulfonema ishimotonii TaxID=45657 RepID=A0A401G0Y4_9BACT|nr:DUF6794 domain-containing protein [Desulfonema ishimotonii]GBC62870.1 hypothetical protein DENIS_3854 [Desulfonema ishimotonii]